MTSLRTDVAIVGGGMVGAACALALAQRGVSVVVIESRAPATDWDDSGFDLRVSAISRASQHLFGHLGVWQSILADRATPYQSMHVWDRAGLGEIHFDAADLAAPDLGHIVENRVLLHALWRAFEGGGVTTVTPARPQQLLLDGGNVTGLQLDDGSRIDAALVVAADGARSQLRELAGIESRSESYDESGVVATVHAELGNHATAWQRFMPEGPLALLPLQDELFSIVWTTRPETADKLATTDESSFNDALTEASEARLGRLTLLGDRAVFPLRLQHAHAYVGPGLALVGDAAHVIHPLAGQGVNLGLLDAAALVDAVLAARAAGHGSGNMRTLRRYERSRKGHNTATQLTMDAFDQLFSNDHAALSLLRNLGLGVVGRVGPLRRLFERAALGGGMHLPSLCRPHSGHTG